MGSVADFIKEISDLEQLQAIRPCQVMATSLLEAACKRFHLQCQATSADLIDLYKAVDKCSLDSSLKQVVLKTVDEKMLISSSETKPLGQHQVLASLCNYLTGKDWELLTSGSQWDGVLCIVKRLRTIGLKVMREETKKCATALLVQCQVWKEGSLPSYDHIYKLSQHVQQAFNSSQQVAAVSGCAKYPDQPELMGSQWMKKAYEESDPPISKSIPSLKVLEQFHTPVRSSSRLLTKTSAGHSPDGQLAADQMLKAVLSICRGSASNAPGIDINVLKPGPKAARLVAGTGATSFKLGGSLSGQSLEADSLDSSEQDKGLKKAHTLQMLQLEDAHPQGHLQTPVAKQAGKEAVPQAETITPEPASSKPGMQSQPSSKDLASYEDDAFALLKNRKSGTAAKATTKARAAKKDKVMKKPAAAPAHSEKYGCSRCRGNVKGCDVCWDPNFAGVRLPGRQAWIKFMEKRKRDALTR